MIMRRLWGTFWSMVHAMFMPGDFDGSGRPQS
jgi:hypothetical protein